MTNLQQFLEEEKKKVDREFNERGKEDFVYELVELDKIKKFLII